MKTKYSFTLTMAAAALLATACKPSGQSSGIKVKVTNSSAFARTDEPVIININDLMKKHPDFNADSTLVYAGDSVIPSQVNDINGDGKADELVFLADLGPEEIKEYTIKKAAPGETLPVYKKRTHAELSNKTGGHWEGHKYIGGTFMNTNFVRVPDEQWDHSGFFRYEGPGWESDKVGYRFYLDERNAIDIFGKKTDKMVLQNVGLDGFESYHHPAPWGQDIFKVGASLGIGSIAMWKDYKVNMVSKTDSVTCRIALNGPVESMIETNYYGWKVDDKKLNLRSQLSIFGGSRMTKNSLLLQGDSVLLCTGIVKEPGIDLMTQQNPSGWTYLASWGQQSLAGDSLGIAVLIKTNDLVKVTADSLSHVAVLKPENDSLEYYLLAAWEQEPGGITSKAQFRQYLDNEIQKLNNPVKVEY